MEKISDHILKLREASSSFPAGVAIQLSIVVVVE
jgi:hypothetical protein